MNRRLAALTIALTGLAAGGCVPLMVGGVATGVLVADDRRTSGTVVDDQNIELRVANEISTQFGKVSNANVTCYNRVLLITGEATTEQARAGIEKVARAQAGVRHLDVYRCDLCLLNSTTEQWLLDATARWLSGGA